MMPPYTDPTTLSEISLFRGLSTEQLEKLASLLHEWTFPAGTGTITAEGSQPPGS